MGETGITCRIFCDRMYKCSEYKEPDDYVKMSRLLFERVLRVYSQDTSRSLLDVFAKEFTNRSFTGIRSVYTEHTISYKKFCIECVTSLNLFFNKYNPSVIMDKYSYKHKIKGYMGCVFNNYNVHFTYKNVSETDKDLDFASLNSYIYNQVHGLSNACLVMSVPTNTFFLLDYDEKDYTMGRGFLVQTKKTKLKRRGTHCFRCKNSCKPLYLNGIDRLEAHL